MWSYEEFLKHIQEDNVEQGGCAYEKMFEIFQGKWNMRVLYELCKAPSLRFNQLQKAIPNITNAMLIKTLKELEQFGILKREQFNEIPPHVEYSLTDAGKELLPIFYEMAKWAGKHIL